MNLLLSGIRSLRKCCHHIRLWGRVWNKVVDYELQPVALESVADVCNTSVLDMDEDTYWRWVREANLPFANVAYPHKKALEFFFSSNILDIQPRDHLLDAAGGRSDYLDAIRTTCGCKNLSLHDHIYSGAQVSPDGVRAVGGDIGSIALPEASFTKLSCHHAFEHFQEHKDVAFIREVARLLQPGGRACIIPLFLADQYAECWNISHQLLFDDRAQLIVDKTASLPGTHDDGHFARLYDVEAFHRRVVVVAREAGLEPRLVACRLGGQDTPDMDKNFGSKLNCPLRALVLDKSL